MRRHVKRSAFIARFVGWALLFIAAVLSIYVAASTGKRWKEFREAYGNAGMKTDFPVQLAFDKTYYRSLSGAASARRASDEERAQLVREKFSAFEQRAGQAQLFQRDLDARNIWESFETGFDTEAFLARFEGIENSLEQQQITELTEYLDSLGGPAGKGKKVAHLKPASQAEFYQGFYEKLKEEKQEAAGSYVQFLAAVKKLIDDDIAAGNTIKNTKTWLEQSFPEEAYLEALEQAESEDDARSSLIETLREKIGVGEEITPALEQTWGLIREQNPDADELAYLMAVQELLGEEGFDGSLKMISERMEQKEASLREESFSAFLDRFDDELVFEADDRSIVGIVAPFWWVVSHFVFLWIAGVVLVLYGIIADKLLALYLVRKLEKEQTETESEPGEGGDDIILKVDRLCQYFRSGSEINKAVDDVSFFVRRGEVFGLVGESGCGKTTTGRTIINLYDPTSGDVYFNSLRISSGRNALPVLCYSLRKDAREKIAARKEKLGRELAEHPENSGALRQQYSEDVSAIRKELSEKLKQAQNDALESEAEKSRARMLYRRHKKEQLTRAFEQEKATLEGEALAERTRRYHAEMKAADRDEVMTRMQMIFQDPIASIDPRMTVREIIAEGLRIRGIRDKKIIDQRVYEMLDMVGLVSEHADRYPHEFSGGQRQRIGIARAIALEPELIIADEPISALDVSIQAQVINLLNDLREKMGLTIVFIAHNLSVVKYFSDRIAVMYYGHIVEMTSSEELFAHPLHPYTKSLLSAIPYPDPHYEKNRKRIEYQPARVHDYSTDLPSLREIVPDHYVRCNEAEYRKYCREYES